MFVSFTKVTRNASYKDSRVQLDSDAIQLPDAALSTQSLQPLVIPLAHITLGRKKDSFYMNIRNPIPQKV